MVNSGQGGWGREVALGAAMCPACLGLSCITSLSRVDGPGRILNMYAREGWKDAGREERKDGCLDGCIMLGSIKKDNEQMAASQSQD